MARNLPMKRFTVTIGKNADNVSDPISCLVEDHLSGDVATYIGATDRAAMTPAAAWITAQLADKNVQHVDAAGELTLP
jgi:hypothetical protein